MEFPPENKTGTSFPAWNFFVSNKAGCFFVGGRGRELIYGIVLNLQIKLSSFALEL